MSGDARANADNIKSTQQFESKQSGPSKIDAKVLETLRTQELAAVFVRLNVPVITKKKLTPEEEQTQKRTIATAQEQVLQELAGTKYKLRRKFEIVPTLSMEVGTDAIAVLEKSAHVSRVYEVAKIYPTPDEITPHPDKQK